MSNKQRSLSDFKNTPRVTREFPNPSVGSPYQIGQDPRPEIAAEINELNRQLETAKNSFGKFLLVTEEQKKVLQKELSVLVSKKNDISKNVSSLYLQSQKITEIKKNMESGLDRYAVYFLKVVFTEAREAFESAENKLKEAQEESKTVEEKKILVDEALGFLDNFKISLDAKQIELNIKEERVKQDKIKIEKQKKYLDQKEANIDVILVDAEWKLKRSDTKLKESDNLYSKIKMEFDGKKKSLEDFNAYLDQRSKILNAVENYQKIKDQALNEKAILVQDRQETLDRVAKELRVK